MLEHPIKTLGLSQVRVSLHPEVSIPVTVNVARSPEEAERQARGERVDRRGGGSRGAGANRRDDLRRRHPAGDLIACVIDRDLAFRWTAGRIRVRRTLTNRTLLFHSHPPISGQESGSERCRLSSMRFCGDL